MFHQLEALPESQHTQLKHLRAKIKDLKAVCVAYSGGVDSSLVAAIAKEQLGQHAIAITGVSPALATHLKQEARAQAQWLGIRHQECITHELNDPAYSKNPINRCFACKKELYQHLSAITQSANGYKVINGINKDDLKDHRPGMQAAKDAGVLSPLAELNICKIDVRQISRSLGFPWWNKPAQPCLASRFPYGEQINEDLLKQVNKAENWLRENGFEELRVRSRGLEAKIEVPDNQIEKLILDVGRQKIVDYFLRIGFTSVSIDLEGLISGKLNRKQNFSETSEYE